MSRILVVFASIDGQAGRIAERIAGVLRETGNTVTVRSAQSPGVGLEIAAHDAVVLGSAIRYGRHVRSLETLVREHRQQIERRPNAFFSVCLSAGGPGAKPAVAAGYVGDFLRRTGWRAQRTASFAGALPYTRYGPFIRLLMRLIVGAAGGDTDTSRDYEYTDWDAVERFARGCAA